MKRFAHLVGHNVDEILMAFSPAASEEIRKRGA